LRKARSIRDGLGIDLHAHRSGGAADPDRIGPGQHDNLADPSWRDTRIRQTAGRGRFARGDVRIAAVMDAQSRALCALKHDLQTGCIGVFEISRRGPDVWLQIWMMPREPHLRSEDRLDTAVQDLARGRDANALLGRSYGFQRTGLDFGIALLDDHRLLVDDQSGFTFEAALLNFLHHLRRPDGRAG